MGYEPGLYETNTPTWWLNEEGGEMLRELAKQRAITLERMTLWDRAEKTWLVVRVNREMDGGELSLFQQLGSPYGASASDWQPIAEVVTLEQSRHAQELAEANEPTTIEIAEQWIRTTQDAAKTVLKFAALAFGFAALIALIRRR